MLHSAVRCTNFVSTTPRCLPMSSWQASPQVPPRRFEIKCTLVRVAIRSDLPLLALMFAVSLADACAPILGNEFDVVGDAATSTTTGAAGDTSTMTGTAGDGVDHGDTFLPPERDAATEAAVKADAPSQQQADAEPVGDGGSTGKHLVINEVDYD